jgi:quercetin dioxygenase-like cupin family protein
MMTKINQPSKSKLNTKSIHDKKAPVLNDEINAAIASKITPTIPAPEVAMRIKTKLMQRVQAETHQFVFASQGTWKTVFAGVQIKLLHKTAESKSFLMKLAENTSIPAHSHSHDEESFVVDGSVTIEGILCHAGDYHYAQAGSKHQTIQTSHGCTLLVRSL